MILGGLDFGAINGDLTGYALTLGQVVLIDLALAGDNAVAVGLAASGLPTAAQQRRVIFWGIALAVILRIALALVAVQLLKVVGLLLAGGLLLLWVAWRTWTDIAAHGRRETLKAEIARAIARDPEGAAALAAAAAHPALRTRSFASAIILVLVTDVSVSLDNVLAVAGAARERPLAMLVGLLLSAVMVAFGASLVARLIGRWRWIGYIAALVVLATGLKMIWDGGIDVIQAGYLDGLCGCRAGR
jgi:YjbE family integral membrane protein